MKRLIFIGLLFVYVIRLQAGPQSVLPSTKDYNTTQVILMPKTEALLSSQLVGTVKKLPIQEGEFFDEGDVLVEFDCTIHEAQLDKSKAILESKLAAYNSNIRMSKAKAVSTVELLQSKAEFIEAKADVKIKQHMVDFCQVKAPFNGRLIKLHVNAFESLTQGEPLVDILDNTELTIELIVPSHWLAWLKKDSPFNLFIAETNKTYQAHITKILPRVDSVSQSIRLLGILNNNHPELIAGMSGKAQFQRKQNEVR